ncbi:MAG: DUF2844 domain-containing protein [Steroidobacteraceae bacterium]
MKSLRTWRLPTALVCAGLTCSASAWAALGGDVASVEADRTQLQGALAVSSAGGYEVREITTVGGGVVREYLTADGKVFALSWHGPTIPDLRQLLGAYYARYVQGAAAASHAGGHRHFTVTQPGLVLESSGRLRAFTGRAWDPQLLPQSFSADDIR